MNSELLHQLNFLGTDLVSEIITHSVVQKVPKGQELFKEKQYIKVLPIVLNGSIKVVARFEKRELLLYYIQANQSCVMSFSACLKNEPSKIFAITEEDSEIIFMPISKIRFWLKEYPSFGSLFYEQYDLRFNELLDTIQHVLIDKMDKRLLDYLIQKSTVTGQSKLKISHIQIANELGTVREVISRVMKKLEVEGKVVQEKTGIRILCL